MTIQDRWKSNQVRKIFGNCSNSTLYRMWKVSKTLAPPTVIRGINYWTLEEVEQAFQNSKKGEVKADTTPTKDVPAPLKTAVERAAHARRGRAKAYQSSKQGGIS